MEQYLIDTNVVSDYLAATLPKTGIALMDQVIDAIPNISVITQIELLCWKTTKSVEQKVQNLITDSTVLLITPDVITHCVRIRRDKKIKMPDAIIAATALAYNLVLVTHNIKDFAGVQRLGVINPHAGPV